MTTAALSRPRLCGASLAWNGKPPWCHEPAAMLARAGCVHEHVGEIPVCWACLSGLRKFSADGDWECQACWSSPEPHACPMPMVVIPLGAS